MAFSDAFARGYAVGESMKKRKAISDHFKKVQELTADDEEEMVAEDGTAIPINTPAGAEVAAAIPAATGGEEAAIPVAGVTPEAPAAEAAPAPTPAAEAAIPVAPEKPAAPAAETAPAAEAAIPVAPEKTPEEKKLAKEIEKKVEKGAKKSLSQDNIKELDRLAMEAARASGDIQVYTALQQTTNSILQAKVLSNLGLAQKAAQNPDNIENVKKYLKKAYRFVPDGQEVDFVEKDGKLWINDPWEDGKQIEMGSEQIGYLATMIRDPEKWSEMVRTERKERAKAKLDERGVAVQERNADTNEKRAGIEEQRAQDDRDQFIKTYSIAQSKEAREAAGQKYDNLLKMAQAANYFAEAEYTKAGKSGAAGGMKPDDMRQYGVSVGNEIEGFLSPKTPPDPNDPLSRPGVAPPPPAYAMFVNRDKDGNPTGGLSPLGMQAKDLGGAIGIANPELGPAGAARAGMEITRALVDDKGPKLAVSPSRGTVTIPIGGRLVAVKVPPAVMESFIAAAKQQQPESK